MPVFQPATKAQLPLLVALLADDALGRDREMPGEPLHENYVRAFEAIQEDENNELVVAMDGADIVGMLQLTFIPGISRCGSWRLLIEGVRVAAGHRGKGYGREMLEWAIARGRQRGCALVQLTTDKARTDARRFYESLGFVASHEGMKLPL